MRTCKLQVFLFGILKILDFTFRYLYVIISSQVLCDLTKFDKRGEDYTKHSLVQVNFYKKYLKIYDVYFSSYNGK